MEFIQFKESLNINIEQKEMKPIYILCKFSIISNQNIDLRKLINNQLSMEERNSIHSGKFNFTFDEMKNYISNNNEFYIVDKPFLINIGFNTNCINPSNMLYFTDNSKKYIFFQNEGKILKFFQDNSLINNNMNINIIVTTISVLLYANEQELNKIFQSNIKDEYNIKKYYLVNKKWIDNFKSVYNYKNIYNLLSKLNQFDNYNGYEKNLEIYLYNNDLLNYVKNFQSIPNSLIKEINIYPQIINDLKEGPQFKCPVDFELVPKSLFNLIKSISKIINEINIKKLKYKVLIGNNNLYLEDNENPSIFYIYCFNKANHSYNPFSTINFLKEKYFYRYIFQFLKEDAFVSHIIKKNYDTNKLYNPQEIYDLSNTKIGEIIFKLKLSEDYIKKEKIKIIKKHDYLIFNNYKKFYNQLSSLQNQNLDLSNINDIEININQNKLIFLRVYLIEENNMNYYKKMLNFEYFKNFDENSKINQNIADFPYNDLNNLKIEIQSENNLNLQQRYCLVNEVFCENLNLPKEKYNSSQAILFINNNNKFIFFRNSKLLLKLENINKNSFNISQFGFFNNSKNLILNNLIQLYKKEKEINNSLASEQINYKTVEFYFINNKWLEEYKIFYNFNLIRKILNENNQNNNNLLSYINNNKLPNIFLIENNIYPKIENIFNNGNNAILNYPINFDIVEKNIMDSIIKEINLTNNINIKLSLTSGKFVFINNRIYIKNLDNTFYICSKFNNEYKINYIIKIDKDDNFNNFVKPIFYKNFNIENYFTCTGLNINQIKKVQNIIINNLFVGYFISISPNINYNINEPRHCLGLQNIGATCYMNATLQCLCHISSLKNYFKDRNQIKIDIQNKNTPLAKEFYEVIDNLWKKSKSTYYAPYNFKNIISSLNPLFKGIQANDSKDLILFIFETLHKELNNPNSYNINNIINCSNISNELKIFRQNYYSQNYSIISKIFYSEQSNNLECCSCNCNKISFNIFNFLIFPLEKIRLYLEKKKPEGFINVSLYDCFEQNEEKQLLNGQNKIYCNNCGRNSDALSFNKIYNCPEVLTIILNRGKGLEFDVEFIFPMNLNIEKYVIDKNCDTKYELIGVITHLGPSGMSGHFIAYCKSPVDKKWYCYNDAQVTQCVNAEYEINSRGIPYVLFYQKFKIKAYLEKNLQNNYSNHNGNNFILYFTYNDQEGALETNQNELCINFIKQLYIKYNWLPQSGVSFFIMKGIDLVELELKKTLFENQIKNGDKIIIA